MSWQDYVNAYLVNLVDQSTGKVAYNVCEHGAIIGNTDGAVWASTPGFSFEKYTTEIEQDDGTNKNQEITEFDNLLDAFNNKGLTKRAGGIRINKEKYVPVNFDEERNVMYLKRKSGGACVAKSNLGFVIGTFDPKLQLTKFDGKTEGQNPGMTNRACEDLQKFLVENNL